MSFVSPSHDSYIDDSYNLSASLEVESIINLNKKGIGIIIKPWGHATLDAKKNYN